jgi:transposase-like protein
MSERCPLCSSLNIVTHVRQGKVVHKVLGQIEVADVGWRCEDCGHEWGFEYFKKPEEERR